MIDVRSADEYAAGHIPGAMNVPLDEIENRLDDLSRLGPVLVVCQSGQRAEMACELIGRAHGGLLRLDGGTDAWLQAGGPVVASRKVRWSLERQVRLGAGLLVLIGVTLGFLVHPGWFGLAGFIGAGLTFSGLTGFCGMAKILALMPWNRAASAGDSATRS
ncbi:MAG: membrane protein [Fimbriimonadales bacterium]|nr:MAG: membrane protein [Fimbriimonadales bacterium]